MKINILYSFRDGPWGGGNQFLKALKKDFTTQGVYEDDPKKAQVVIFNVYPFSSEHLFKEALNLKKKFPQKAVIYRLDGPLHLYRDKDKEIDRITKIFGDLLVDGIIFQSNWCQEKNHKILGIDAPYQTVIYNAPDDSIFNPTNRASFDPKQVKLVATSWSNNWNKGFEIFQYLDKNLDHSRYKFTFVGNSPIAFKNVNWIKPVSSDKLARILQQNDIFITASQSDPCSNSLIEALSCGLPAVILNDGGHPELVKAGGETFVGKDDILKKIDKIANNYYQYSKQIPEYSIKNSGGSYLQFAQTINNDIQNQKYYPKSVNWPIKARFLALNFRINKWKLLNKISSKINQIKN